MRKLLSFLAMSAVVLGMAFTFNACGGNDPELNNVPEGAIKGKFTVDKDGKQVYFSKGNLQASYGGSKWNWFFATNQWDYVGNATANTSITGDGTVSVNDTVDLFGWSTVATYYGINKSKTSSDYSGNFEEWGNNIGEGWRTLSKDEWAYLFTIRTAASDKYGMATVANVHGIIVLPDVYEGTAINTSHSAWGNNTISTEAWADYEAAGAVFLPAVGYREGTDVNFVGSSANYWSSTPYPYNEVYAYLMYFDSKSIYPLNSCNRKYGQSVRLVQDYR